ncbi:MAG: hypothetical protein OXT09_17730 [Myxococcales bacterium]|nr:hypothetical protein [Myxococcales bacterium]
MALQKWLGASTLTYILLHQATTLAAPPQARQQATPTAAPTSQTPGDTAQRPSPAPAPPTAKPGPPATPDGKAAPRAANMHQSVVLFERPRRHVDSDQPASTASQDDEPPRILHGFRLGYGVWLDYESPTADEDDDRSPKEKYKLESPHHFLIGYEIGHRLPAGSEALNILVVGNVMIAGLEQSKLLPNANLILGAEIERALQLGVGLNLAPDEQKPAHMVLAAGWTPRNGDLYLPIHFFFVPDVDGHHRLGVTAGVTWAR